MKYLTTLLALGIAGCVTNPVVRPVVPIVQENYTNVPTIEDCVYTDYEKSILNEMILPVDISKKDCAKTKVAQFALSFLEKVAVEFDMGSGITSRRSYNVDNIIEEAMEHREFRRALILVDRNRNGVDYEEAKNLVNFLDY